MEPQFLLAFPLELIALLFVLVECDQVRMTLLGVFIIYLEHPRSICTDLQCECGASKEESSRGIEINRHQLFIPVGKTRTCNLGITGIPTKSHAYRNADPASYIPDLTVA